MPSTLIVFIAVLAIAGGIIAWLGDRLGTWVGKKRISKFGLRPRHTAMLYTVWTGVIIAVGTLGLLIHYDHNVERALVEGRKIIDDNRRLKADNAELKEQRQSQEKSLNELR